MSDTLSPSRRLDLGMVLTAPNGDRYLVIDIYDSAKLKLCRLPPDMTAADLNVRFFHTPTIHDPAHSSLSRE